MHGRLVLLFNRSRPHNRLTSPQAFRSPAPLYLSLAKLGRRPLQEPEGDLTLISETLPALGHLFGCPSLAYLERTIRRGHLETACALIKTIVSRRHHHRSCARSCPSSLAACSTILYKLASGRRLLVSHSPFSTTWFVLRSHGSTLPPIGPAAYTWNSSILTPAQVPIRETRHNLLRQGWQDLRRLAVSLPATPPSHPLLPRCVSCHLTRASTNTCFGLNTQF